MAKAYGRQKRHEKTVNLALQGGGAHGAFTWGVLDRILSEDRLWIAAISGTSAGAMNAVVATQGMYDGGAKGAREALAEFWHQVAEVGKLSPIQRTPLDKWLGSWSLDLSPGYLWMDMMSRLASPYDFNPFDVNPLRDLVAEFVDFDKVAGEQDMGLYISATNVETGRVRVFHRHEVTLDVVMASACLPFLYKAVEIDGVPYWDGGYMGNPVLMPFVQFSPCADIMIVQINPLERPGVPDTAREILNRVNEITFNASLMRELRLLDTINMLLETGRLNDPAFRQMRLHMVEGGPRMLELSASSKMNSEWRFFEHLHDIGWAQADQWLRDNYDALGERSTLDLDHLFADTGLYSAVLPIKASG